MDPKLIAERRKMIEADAPCAGCGATLSFCEANRGKDPTAPPWFGCCARGPGLVSCHHEPDQAALRRLLKEIEAGEVRSPEDILLDSIEEYPLFSPGRRGRSLRARVMELAMESWPDDVPMEGYF